MKDKYFFIAICACLACLVIGMVCGTLIERRHFNFWFPADEREQVRADIEKLRKMLTEMEEIKMAMDALNRETEKSVIWNRVTLRPRLSDGD